MKNNKNGRGGGFEISVQASVAILCFRLGADSISSESIKQQLKSIGPRSLWWLQPQDESKAADGKVSTVRQKI